MLVEAIKELTDAINASRSGSIILDWATLVSLLVAIFSLLANLRSSSKERKEHVVEMGILGESIRNDTKQAEANLVVDRYSSYDRLFSEIEDTYSLIRKHEDLLEKIDFEIISENVFDYIDKDFFVVAERDVWPSARSVKVFYKSGFALTKTNLFSPEIMKLVLERGSFRDLMKIGALDICRFHYLCKKKEMNFSETEVQWEDRKWDYAWYDDLIAYVKKVGST